MPTALSIIDFAPFQLDLRAGQLRRGNTPLPLRPKTFAVLQHLAERPGELVTKQALLDRVWGHVAVSEDVVRLSVGELRGVLGDERTAPRFIETVPRRGYRFVARMDRAGTARLRDAAEPLIDDSARASVVVGRTNERAQVAGWLRTATSGARQIGFVTGEAGIGKTTLVDSTLADLRRISPTSFRIARGQCVEHYGGGEPYLPLLEAVTSLCRGADRATVETILREHAPDWLLRVTGLSASQTSHGTEPLASTQEHTLHSLAESLEALAVETPLVLVLEDVQWSDYSTLDLLSLVARRRAPARLLVLCTLRPADAIARAHPVAAVKRELLRKGLCREILLGGLSESDVASYLAARFPAADLPEELLSLLIDRSDGNPFFLVALVDHLLAHRLLVDSGNGWKLREEIETLRTAIPDGLRAIIEPRLDRLAPDERAALEAASVAGPEFAAHAVAHSAHGISLGNVEYVEELCDALVRREEILRATGESAWPDGTTSARYAFRHALYQQVIYQNLSASTRRRLHQTIGETLEAAYSTRTADVASALASHFERSRDVHRAVRYHGEAAVRARARFAYGESRLHLEAALELTRAEPETPDGLQQQMPLLEQLGWTLSALRGWGDEGAARVFTQMRALAERIDGALARFQAMEGQLIVHTMRAEYAEARARGVEMLALAEQHGNRAAVAQALPPIGATLIHLGELQAAHDIAERAWALCDREEPTLQAISACNLLASTSAHLGLIVQARALNSEAVALAAKVDIPYIRAHATHYAAAIYGLLRDVAATQALASEAAQIATAHGFPVFRASATIYRGWCDVQQGRFDEGIAALRSGLVEYVSTGQRIGTTSYSLPLVEGYLAIGNGAAANEVLDTALAFMAETGERIYEHEIYRLKGECLLAGSATRSEKADATKYFERAIAIAADQKALLFELRAATSLGRIQKSARERLTPLLNRFGPQDDCADVHAARALLRGDVRIRT